MNRRNLMKAMLTLPAAGALGGCREKSSSASHDTLRVVLHGPFALVLYGGKPARIKAFVPFVDEDEKDRKHVFFYPTPNDEVGKESDHRSFRFELSPEGLEVNERPPYVDHGFDDFTIHTGAWEPEPKKYFVAIDLPAPEFITFPVRGNVFENVRFTGGQTAKMPLNQVLDYRVRDLGKVRMLSNDLESRPPLSYSDVRQKYREADQKRSAERGQPAHPNGSVRQEYTRGSDMEIRTFFFGVGLPEPTAESALGAHAVSFFNDKLLKSFPNSPDATGRHLDAVGVPLCSSTGSDVSGVVPAALTYPIFQPPLRLITATDDCRLGGLIAIKSLSPST